MRNGVCCDTLRYSAPSHGDWGIVRVASLVPESHMLFVCPFACGRHGALGAIDQGFKHRLSYVYIDQKDIVEGYDKEVRRLMEELLTRLPRRPRAVFVYVSCLDDLIGSDLGALMEELHHDHPDVEFRAGHMNPISLDTKAPPPLTTQDAMFSFLDAVMEKTGGVNLIGNLVEVEKDSELYRLLDFCGAGPVRHMSHYDTFDSFQEMARSRYNLVLSPIASLAAKNMEKKHGIPYLMMPVTYDVDEIAANYRRMAEFFGAQSACDFTDDIALTQEAIAQTREIVGSRPVWIAQGAVVKPFTLANALRGYGFNVTRVVAEDVIPIDRAGFEALPEGAVEILQPQHPDVIRFAHRDPEALVIGFDAAYLSGSAYIVNLSGDQGNYGYAGVRRLMRMMAGAALEKSDLKQLIDEYGVVV